MAAVAEPGKLQSAQEKVTGFQPKPEDLDYPNKLSRLAEDPELAGPDSQAEQLPLMTDNGHSAAAQDSTVSEPNLIISVSSVPIVQSQAKSHRLT